MSKETKQMHFPSLSFGGALSCCDSRKGLSQSAFAQEQILMRVSQPETYEIKLQKHRKIPAA